MGDIQADGGIRVQPVGDHFCSDAADFFLDAVGKDDIPGGVNFALVKCASHFGSDEAAEPVVQRAADEAGIEHERLIAIHGAIAHAQPHFLYPEFRRLFEIFADMDGGVADDTHYLALPAEETEAAAAGNGDIAAAEAFYVGEAVVGDMADGEADFIGVGVQHEGGSIFSPTLQRGPGRAIGIAFLTRGIRCNVGRPETLRLDFHTRGGRGAQECVQELNRLISHFCYGIGLDVFVCDITAAL